MTNTSEKIEELESRLEELRGEEEFLPPPKESQEKKELDDLISKIGGSKALILVLVGVVLVALMFYAGIFSSPERDETLLTREISSSVVSIFCPDTSGPFSVDSEDGYGGSGTIIDERGFIITNNHVIPQNEEFLDVHEEGCFVILPDPNTGEAAEIYLGDPIVYPGLSDDYDLAFIEIYAPYEDEEYVYGEYDKVFPAFDDSSYSCAGGEYVRLGESVTVYGYPGITGGYNLTITKGQVSSIDSEYDILYTSAKITSGNSGGLAVDERGCMIGIPTFVQTDEYETIGVIVGIKTILDFIDKASELK
jgi:S1-C subfamily serine protease